VPIERNGGCMHMTCRCGHEFFWCCLRAYRNESEAREHRRHCD
jgi:ariadne-1